MAASTTFDSTLSQLGIARSGGTTGTSATTATKNKSTMDQSDFLKLMTTQLKNQDPFSPVDNTQMVAQMAQFSSVAGISEMNKTLSSIMTKLNGTTTSDALSYVGKTVLTEGGTAFPRTSGGIAGAVELGAAASDVTVTIADKNGAVLKTLTMANKPAGTSTFDWDGITDDGQTAGAGPYKVTLSALNNGVAVSAKPLVWAPVESVSLPSGGTPVLSVTGLGQVALSAVRSVG